MKQLLTFLLLSVSALAFAQKPIEMNLWPTVAISTWP